MYKVQKQIQIIADEMDNCIKDGMDEALTQYFSISG